LGYVDDDGSFFDKTGHKWARVDERSKVLDLDGCYIGHIDGQGNFFAEQARWLGYLRDWHQHPTSMDVDLRAATSSRSA